MLKKITKKKGIENGNSDNDIIYMLSSIIKVQKQTYNQNNNNNHHHRQYQHIKEVALVAVAAAIGIQM